ncbi:MAG: hypothetical protein JJ899_00505 [Alphaproteobacteria bacterium]|nr:hypothetical protein [Alphaproteobacteria bacterium]
MASSQSHVVVATFNDTDKFLDALEKLLDAGVAPDRISVLADHDAIVDRFGRVPPAAELADDPGTPRESLGTKSAIDDAIDFISESVAVLTEIGTAAAAYAVGGPVGVATGTSAAAQLSVDDLLSEHVDDDWREQLQENVRDGGIVCWVHATGPAETAQAQEILRTGGGTNIHETTAS